MKKILLALTLACQPVLAAVTYDTYVFGANIYDITSVQEGLLIRLENDAVPKTCPKGYAWMLIPQTSKVIIAVTLAHWYQKKRAVEVYVEPYSGSGYCKITQIQPK